MFNEVGQMSPGHMLPEQILFWMLSIVKVEPGKLPLKFGQNRISNSLDIANIQLLVGGGGGRWLVAVAGGGSGGGVETFLYKI